MPRRLLAAALFAFAALPVLASREFVDDAGRKVQLPDRIERVYAAGPPASVLVFALAPDKLIGWTRAFREDEAKWVPRKYAELPELGRLTGRGNTANVEVVLKAKPDLIVDVGSTSATFASLADRVQEQTGIPYVLLDGHLDTTVKQIEKMADVLGTPAEGRELAAYASGLLAELRTKIDAIPAKDRPEAYYARGPQGLTTGLAGSINVEMIEFLGAKNVAGGERGGLTNVGLEQVVLWDPSIIVTNDPNFYREVWKLPVWNSVSCSAQQARVPLAASSVRMVRLSTRREPHHRAPVARGHPLSEDLPLRPHARGAALLQALLPPGTLRGAGRRDPRRARRGAPMIIPRARFALGLAASAVALVVLVAWSFTAGRFAVAAGDVWRALFAALTGQASGLPDNVSAIVLQVRAPRVAAALAVGAALAAAGAAYQNLFRNPLVSPDILGVSAGCALGAGIALLFSMPIAVVQVLAFAGGLIAVALVVTIGTWIGGRDPILTLVLTGVVVGSLCGAGIALVKYVADPYNQLPAITFWLLGSFTGALPRDLMPTLLPIAAAIAVLAALRWRIDVLALSEDEARSLGVNVRLLRLVVIVVATLATASAVSLAGTIG